MAKYDVLLVKKNKPNFANNFETVRNALRKAVARVKFVAKEVGNLIENIFFFLEEATFYKSLIV